MAAIEHYIDDYYKSIKAMSKFDDNEGSTETAMKVLLMNVGKEKNLTLVKPRYKRSENRAIIYDGVLKTVDGWNFGYWEAKDRKDDLEKEIRKKIEKGYSCKNILFENTQIAVLYQNGEKVGEWDISDKSKKSNLIRSC